MLTIYIKSNSKFSLGYPQVANEGDIGSHKYFESAVRDRQQRVTVQPFTDDQ